MVHPELLEIGEKQLRQRVFGGLGTRKKGRLKISRTDAFSWRGPAFKASLAFAWFCFLRIGFYVRASKQAQLCTGLGRLLQIVYAAGSPRLVACFVGLMGGTAMQLGAPCVPRRVQCGPSLSRFSAGSCWHAFGRDFSRGNWRTDYP